MESYIQISQLNDFVFCPKSIYFHNLYGRYTQSLYHAPAQTVGKIKHERIDTQKYSSAKKYLQGLEVFSEKYNLCGKIDLFDTEAGALIERKNKIKQIYDGYRYQLYGQYFCLQEMGYEVKALFLHSLTDNKRYELVVPDEKIVKEFEGLIAAFHAFDLTQKNFKQNPAKCAGCIYRELCDSAAS
jgi:CRISPR-associated protein Cas4